MLGGHEDATVEDVVDATKRYAVVRKKGDAYAAAAQLDPRQGHGD